MMSLPFLFYMRCDAQKRMADMNRDENARYLDGFDFKLTEACMEGAIKAMRPLVSLGYQQQIDNFK